MLPSKIEKIANVLPFQTKKMTNLKVRASNVAVGSLKDAKVERFLVKVGFIRIESN